MGGLQVLGEVRTWWREHGIAIGGRDRERIDMDGDSTGRDAGVTM